MLIMGQLNKLLLLTTLNFVKYFLAFFRLRLKSCAIASYANCLTIPFSQPLPLESIHAIPPLNTIPPVTASEVSKLLTLMPSKTSILDYIRTSLLKSSHLIFSELIAKLANMSFQEGCFPQSFKTALVTPLIKKPNLDPSNFSNYRPISNLNNMSKIVEQLCPLTSSNTHPNIPQFQPLPISLLPQSFY